MKNDLKKNHHHECVSDAMLGKDRYGCPRESFLDTKLGTMTVKSLDVSAKIESLAFKARTGQLDNDYHFITELGSFVDELKKIIDEYE